MATAELPCLTPEQYLEIERKAEFRSEYLDGVMYAMAGASLSHILIVTRTVRELGNALQGHDCDVLSTDMRVHVPATGLYSYPDIMVTCGPIQLQDKHHDTLLNPILIAEVLSPSTSNYDRGEKSRHYRSIPSFREYLILAQDEMRAEQHVRQQDGSWLFREHSAPGDVIRLVSADCSLVLSSLYERVEFSKPESAAVN